MLLNHKKSVRKNQFYINHVSHLKQENDPPLQLNTEECTFHFSFYISLGPLTCSRLKISIALRALSALKFCATFYEFKVF